MTPPILTVLARVGLAIAAVGTISSTVFLFLALEAARRFKRDAKLAQQKTDAIPRSSFPPVTVLKPVHGTEPNLQRNLETFFLQDYPSYEIVFGCRNADDPALIAVRNLQAKYPHVPVRIVLSGHPTWPNAKVYSLAKMIDS